MYIYIIYMYIYIYIYIHICVYIGVAEIDEIGVALQSWSDSSVG